MSKRSIRNEPFWRLAVRIGIIFIIVVIIIELIWHFFSYGNLDAISESFNNGKWIVYSISKIILGTVYGLTMAYFTKRNAKKQ
jgi:hypothetical protein